MSAVQRYWTTAYWLVTTLLMSGAVAMVVWYTPTEATMGPIQKIFYLHLPVAMGTFLACLLSFIASIGFLTQRRAMWDDLAAASARVAVQFCTIVLITGMIWGRSAWGQWWTWSPRLTFSLILWLLYVVYLMVRMSIDPGQRRAMISAIYGIIAFLDVPLVYLSVRLMPDIHPTSIQLAPAMRLTLAVMFVPVFMFLGGLIALRYKLNQQQRVQSQVELEGTGFTIAPPRMRWAPEGT
jgi:heme exporter protein C